MIMIINDFMIMIVNSFLLALAEGLEFVAVVLQLPSILIGELSSFFYTLSRANNNEDNDPEQ